MRMYSFVSHGFHGDFIVVEADLRKGFPGFDVVGLPDSAIRESRERVRSALRNTGASVPQKRVLINLAPASIRKTGSQLDLAIALVISLAQQVAAGEVPPVQDIPVLVVGELALDGSVVPIQDVHTAIAAAQDHGCSMVIVPRQGEGPLPDLVYEVSTLHEAVQAVKQLLAGSISFSVERYPAPQYEGDLPTFDIVAGLEGVQNALSVAAAGGHHALLFGPPGAGKTLCATCFASLLPPPDDLLQQEILRIRSSLGESVPNGELKRAVNLLPITCPRESFPIEVAKSHGGVLIVDEISRMSKGILEQLREVCDRRSTTMRAARKSSEFPAIFQMIGTMHACPCGELGLPDGRCSCSLAAIQRYWRKLGAGLLDRFAIRFPVDPTMDSEIDDLDLSLDAAYDRQKRRYREVAPEIRVNADLMHAVTLRNAFMDESTLKTIAGRLEGRASFRGILLTYTVARTVADLLDESLIGELAIETAIDLRRFGTYDFYWRSF